MHLLLIAFKTTKATGPAKDTKGASAISATSTTSVNSTAVTSTASVPANVAPRTDAAPSTKVAAASKVSTHDVQVMDLLSKLITFNSTQVAAPSKDKGNIVTSVTAAVATTAGADRTPTAQASTIVNLNVESTSDATTNATAAKPQSTANRPSRSLPKRAATNQETSSTAQKAEASQPQHAKTTEKAVPVSLINISTHVASTYTLEFHIEHSTQVH